MANPYRDEPPEPIKQMQQRVYTCGCKVVYLVGTRGTEIPLTVSLCKPSGVCYYRR